MHLSPLKIKARVGWVHHMAVDEMRRILARIVHLAATSQSSRICDTVKVGLILIKYGLKYRHRGCHSGNVLLTLDLWVPKWTPPFCAILGSLLRSRFVSALRARSRILSQSPNVRCVENECDDVCLSKRGDVHILIPSSLQAP